MGIDIFYNLLIVNHKGTKILQFHNFFNAFLIPNSRNILDFEDTYDNYGDKIFILNMPYLCLSGSSAARFNQHVT